MSKYSYLLLFIGIYSIAVQVTMVGKQITSKLQGKTITIYFARGFCGPGIWTGPVRMACLSSTMHGASAGGLAVGFGCWLVASATLHKGLSKQSLCETSWASSQYGFWLPRASVSRTKRARSKP